MYRVETFRESVKVETLGEAVSKAIEMIMEIDVDGFDYQYQWVRIKDMGGIIKAVLGWSWGFKPTAYMKDNAWQ